MDSELERETEIEMFARQQIPSPQFQQEMDEAVANSTVGPVTDRLAIDLPKPMWRGPNGGPAELGSLMARWAAEDAADLER